MSLKSSHVDESQLSSPVSSNQLLPGLHGLRALAATTVVLFHLHHLTSLALPVPLSFIGSHFGMGVQLFFVLSTFSLFYSTSHSVGRKGWASVYLTKRYFRIAPLFYFMLLCWCILFWSRGVSFSLSDVLLNLLLVFNFVPGKHESIVQAGWTVGVEVIMYAFLPFLLLIVRRLSDAFLFACIAVAVSLTVSHQLDLAGGVLRNYAYLSFIGSLGAFSLGILAFKTFDIVKLREVSGKGLSGAIPTAGLVLVVLIWIFVTFQSRHTGWNFPPTVSLMFWCLSFAVLVVTQALGPVPIMASAFMVFLGERSYGIYLTHPMVIFWITPINLWLYSWSGSLIGAWAFLLCGIFTLAVVIFVSAVIYLLIERPGMEIGRFLVRIRSTQ